MKTISEGVLLIRPQGGRSEIKKKLLTRVGTFICHESKLDLLTRRKSIKKSEFSSFETSLNLLLVVQYGKKEMITSFCFNMNSSA